MSIDVMKQALEALGQSETTVPYDGFGMAHREAERKHQAAITALRAAIEHAERPQTHSEECWKWHHECAVAKIERLQEGAEPVAWVGPSWLHPETRGWANDSFESIPIEGWIPLYTAPRQWQKLTDKEIKAPIQRAMQHFGFDATQYNLGGLATIGFYNLVKEIEAKLKEKNT